MPTGVVAAVVCDRSTKQYTGVRPVYPVCIYNEMMSDDLWSSMENCVQRLWEKTWFTHTFLENGRGD
jgi:hypothetical protein